jgi:hypothetical protein
MEMLIGIWIFAQAHGWWGWLDPRHISEGNTEGAGELTRSSGQFVGEQIPNPQAGARKILAPHPIVLLNELKPHIQKDLVERNGDNREYFHG